MSKDRILAIEDDEGVCRLLRHSLAREDYLVGIVHNGEDGLAEAIKNPPDIVLLDLELPGIDGLAVCHALKNNPTTRSLPVIILTGKGEETDVVQGLEMGADDYIVKPFSPKILNARVQAVLRRQPQVAAAPAQQEIFQLGPLVVDTNSNSIKVSGEEIELSPPEYRFALFLICYISGEKLSASCPQMADDESPVSVIGREGMALYSENRLGRLLPILEAIVAADFDSPILLGFYGLALFETNPDRGREYLVASEQKYKVANEPLGELVALSHLVFFHIVFDGDTRAAERYLERAELLNKAFFERLSVYSRVSVAQNLAIGRSFLLNDFSGSNEYLEIAEALAEDRGLVNLVVLNRLVTISEAYVKGDQEALIGGLEDCLRFVNHPQVSNLHKTLLKLMQLKYFTFVGNFNYLRLHDERLRREFQSYLDKDNLVTAQLAVCQLEMLQFDGRFEEVFHLSSETLQRPKTFSNDLVRPILNGFKALSAACCDDHQVMHEAIAACREESGRMTFRLALSKLYCARALALIGCESEAEEILSRIAPATKEQGWYNLDIQIRAQRLLMQKETGQGEDNSIGSLLSDMQERGIWYLQSLTAEDYHRLYKLAVDTGTAVDFAREMMRQRLQVEVDDDGEFYPVLQLTTLGGLKMAIGEDLVARTDEFSRTQRECLALLAAVPEHRLDQEEVQLAFWPDSQPEKARSTLDTMLSRLRRTLKGKLQPHSVKKYLKLQKGVLSLEGVVVDAAEVVKDIGRARDLVRRREFWQADVAYTTALSRWHGQFMPGSCSADQSVGYSHQLQQLCLDASLEWSSLLNESGQARRSIEVLSHALSMDRCNESIMKALYRSHMRDGNISTAHQMLQQFEDVMRAEGYRPSEIARVLATFKSADNI